MDSEKNFEPEEISRIETRELGEGDCEVLETRTFTEAEIRELICTITGVEDSQLTSLNQIMDSDGTLVSINITLNEGRVQERPGHSINFNFMIKARYKKEVKLAAKTTSIDRTYFDDAGDPVDGDMMAEYLGGIWVKSP